MSNIFTLFDGNFHAGGAAQIQEQSIESLSDDSSKNDLIATLSSGSEVNLRVDYSDFSNFVCFNSAENYVTITADQILNSYPYDGTVNDIRLFLDSLDGYQRFFLENWPSYSGHLRFDGTRRSYVQIEDFGRIGGEVRTGLIEMGTGSLTFQCWVEVPALTGSNDCQVIFQKAGPSGSFTVFTSGSRGIASLRSGSVEVTASANLNSTPNFLGVSIDRSNQTMSFYTGSIDSFPVAATEVQIDPIGSHVIFGGTSVTMGSGTIAGKNVIPFTGSIDSVSIWGISRSKNSLRENFCRQSRNQPNLIGSWDFNECSSQASPDVSFIVRDISGHGLDGKVLLFSGSQRGSGSLYPDIPNPILTLQEPSVVDYIIKAQQSGSEYDRSNPNVIFQNFPAKFDSQPFRNFSLILARLFDKIKLHIDHFVNLKYVGYDQFNDAPDEILDEVGRFLGWNQSNLFSSDNAIRFFLGQNVIESPGNSLNDVRLNDIRSTMWRRALRDLVHVYKTKGTRESVEALLRIHGVNRNIVRLKEFSRRAEESVIERWSDVQRTYPTLRFSGSSCVTYSGDPIVSPDGGRTFEFRLKFPHPNDTVLPPTVQTGTVLSFDGDALGVVHYSRPITGVTGSIFLTSSAGRLGIDQVPIFDGNFYSFSIRKYPSSSLEMSVLRHDLDEMVFHVTSSVGHGLSGDIPMGTISYFVLGDFAILPPTKSEFWGSEFRLWNDYVEDSAIIAHDRNPRNYGRESSELNEKLIVHWRMDDDISADGFGSFSVIDSTPHRRDGDAASFSASTSSFDRWIFDHQFIPPPDNDFSDRQIRSFEGKKVPYSQRFLDERGISVEFNLYDSLDEDIANIITSYREIIDSIGIPINKFRGDYEGLEKMRERYFQRLQSDLDFNRFVEMIQFFDMSFIDLIARVIPARAIFQGGDIVYESHMLERPKVQYEIQPAEKHVLELSGSITVYEPYGVW